MMDDAVFCTNCGCAAENISPQKTNASSGGSAGILCILGLVFAFITPLVGLILSIVGRNSAVAANDTKNLGYAKAGLILSIVFLVLEILAVVFYIVMFVIAVDNGGYYYYV